MRYFLICMQFWCKSRVKELTVKLSGALKRSVGLGKKASRGAVYEMLDLKRPEIQAGEVADRIGKKLEKVFQEFA